MMDTHVEPTLSTGDLATPLASDDAILERGQAVLDAEASAILEAKKHLAGEFVDAVRTVLECEGRVCVTGMGKAGLIGHKIQATLASTGTLAYNLHPVEALHGDLGMVHPDDVILALSKSGGSELVMLLPLLKRLGCRVILLTAEPQSAAAQHADHVLHIGKTQEACPLRLAPTSSAASMLALGDALAMAVMQGKAVQPEQYASYHPAGALGRFLMKAGELMRTEENCPRVDESASLGECYEAILNAPRRAGAAAVVDRAGHLVGIVTHGDFFRLFKNHQQAADQPVADVMTREPKRIPADARCMEALDIMRKHAVDELPVVDDQDKLVGMIDIQDMIARGFSVFNGVSD